MSLYLDASALVKRYVEEPESVAVVEAMDGADWVMSRIGYAETARAIHVRERSRMLEQFRRDWGFFEVVEVDEELCAHAAALCRSDDLGTLDAIHLASALAVETDIVVATFDRRLHTAARRAGLETLPAALA